MKILISCVDSIVRHYGSCCNCPVPAYIDKETQDFITINNVPITTTSNTFSVPEHLKPNCKNKHKHKMMPINDLHQNYVRVNGFIICVVEDRNTEEDIKIENSGSNNFVFIH